MALDKDLVLLAFGGPGMARPSLYLSVVIFVSPTKCLIILIYFGQMVERVH